MKETPRQSTSQESLNTESDLRNFLDDIFKLDQSTPQRNNAKECYEKLLARENEFQGSAIEDEYWNAISLELFHMGQIEAQSNDIQLANNHFEKALEAAKKGFSDEWLAYIEGTIHYLDNNQSSLEQVMDRTEGNAHVLQRLLEGLKKRGAPNYKEDYLNLLLPISLNMRFRYASPILLPAGPQHRIFRNVVVNCLMQTYYQM